MRLHKNNTTQKILSSRKPIPCTTLEMQNIVFPKWEDLGLIGKMFRQCVSTKEQPNGNIYDEATYQTVLRIINGKVLMSERPDCYCWKLSKVQSAKDVRTIGTNSSESLVNLCNVMNTISDDTEKAMVADMFAKLKNDLLLVTTPAESRYCIEVTSLLYEINDIKWCVDEWMETDEEGYAEATKLERGDYLIVTEKGVYRIGKEEFKKTHVINDPRQIY